MSREIAGLSPAQETTVRQTPACLCFPLAANARTRFWDQSAQSSLTNGRGGMDGEILLPRQLFWPLGLQEAARPVRVIFAFVALPPLQWRFP